MTAVGKKIKMMITTRLYKSKSRNADYKQCKAPFSSPEGLLKDMNKDIYIYFHRGIQAYLRGNDLPWKISKNVN